jgi:hypothetical protein
MILRFILVIFSVWLSGCASYDTIKPDHTLQASDEKGVVFLSFTKSGLRDVPYELLYRGTESHNKYSSGRIPILWVNDWETPPSSAGADLDWDKYEGRLVALHLKPGIYEFYSLPIEDGYQNAIWSGGKEFSVPFYVEKDRVNYIGNAHVWTTEHREDNDLSYQYSFTNEQERDVALFHEKYKNISKSDVDISQASKLKKIAKYP